jgi:uncharacterized protein YbaR (Trm112 family)
VYQYGVYAPTAPRAPSTKSLSLVYDGTSSSAQDLADAKLKAEGKQRRAELDGMRDIAARRPGEARLYENSLSGNAHVVLEAKRKDGSVLDWLVCDLSTTASPSGEQELMLVVPCPVCNCERGRVGEMMTIRQSNRMFSLDTRKAGKLWVNPNCPTEVYVLAGTITSHERFQCGRCQSHYRIDDSVLRKV